MSITTTYLQSPFRDVSAVPPHKPAQTQEKRTFAGMLWDAGKEFFFGADTTTTAATPPATHDSLPHSAVTEARMGTTGLPLEQHTTTKGHTAAATHTVAQDTQNAAKHSVAGKIPAAEQQAKTHTPPASERRRHPAPIDHARTDAINAFSQQFLKLGGSVALHQLRTLVDAGKGGLNVNTSGCRTLRMPVIPQGPRGLTSQPRWGQSLSENLGGLCARFESGGRGSAAIGYDTHGGTSYGKYQVSSRQGSFDDFVRYLDKHAPDIARKLKSAGPANTGGRTGDMPTMWKKIAEKEGQRFETLQENFVKERHFQPALDNILASTPLKMEHLSEALQEVIWSTAVQHGVAGATRIFRRATARLEGQEGTEHYDKKLISQVYAIRSGQFGSSSPQVRAAVQNRFREEKMLALQLADGKPLA